MIEFLQVMYNTFLLPPGVFIVALICCCGHYHRRHKKWPKVLIAVTLVFYLCSTQWLSSVIIRPLEAVYTVPPVIDGDVIIMLGGGAVPDIQSVHGDGQLSGFAANRLLTAVHLYYQLGLPILVSGGEVYPDSGREAEIAKSILIGLGVPERKILVEGKSRNTTENAKYSKAMLDHLGFKRPILVTSAFHMPRSVRQFEKAGLVVTPVPTDYQSNAIIQLSFSKLKPTAGALNTISLAVKEYVGLAVVQWY